MKEIEFKVLFKNYNIWKEPSITHRLFKPVEIERIILSLKKKSGFGVENLGQSVEGRNIYTVKWGRGNTKILLWSQMHGDEPTATMAFMDLFNFLSDDNDHYIDFKKQLCNHLTLYFIPMLNPDGSARYQRRNALEIDMNRDAIRLQCPESQILDSFRNRIQPDWAFNMHDQRKYYTVGESFETATISFLSPSYDQERSMNAIRSDTMKLIVKMYKCLDHYIPGKIARYTDKYYPLSFGDNFQKSNVRTILVEAGGYPGDPEKQYIRKLHFALLINGLYHISCQSYLNEDIGIYHGIPENSEFLHDLIIRNVQLEKNGHGYRIDLAFKTEEIAREEHWNFYHQSSLKDVGDLSIFHGYKEFNAEGYQLVPGKVYPHAFDSANELDASKCLDLLRTGYTDVHLKELNPTSMLLGLPLRLIPENEKASFALLVGNNPSFYLEKDGVKKYAIVNGFLIDLQEILNKIWKEK